MSKLIFIITCLGSLNAWSAEPMWVNLFPPEARELPRMGITMPSECKTTLDKCKKNEKLEYKKWDFDLFEGPIESSKKVGVFRIELLPYHDSEELIQAVFENVTNSKPEVIPADTDMITGRGPIFNFTILDRKESWIQLPKVPFPHLVWMKLPPSFMHERTFVKVGPKEQYNLGKEEIIITKMDKDSVWLRKVNSNDIPCGVEPVKVPAKELVERRIKFKDLYNEKGHIKLKLSTLR